MILPRKLLMLLMSGLKAPKRGQKRRKAVSGGFLSFGGFGFALFYPVHVNVNVAGLWWSKERTAAYYA
jgi:hypothetical protein